MDPYRQQPVYSGPKLSSGFSYYNNPARQHMFDEKKFYEKLNKDLERRGFSEQDLYGLYKSFSGDALTETLGDAAAKRPEEFKRRLLAYVDEQNALYSRVKEQELEMIREDQASREQQDYDKKVAETTRLSIQESGERAEKARKAQQSKEYLEGQRRDTTGRIAIRRPM